jgi:hypothetical protein
MSQSLINQMGNISKMVTNFPPNSAKFGAGIMLNNKRRRNLLNNVQRVGRRSTHFPIQRERGKENHDRQGQGE